MRAVHKINSYNNSCDHSIHVSADKKNNLQNVCCFQCVYNLQVEDKAEDKNHEQVTEYHS